MNNGAASAESSRSPPESLLLVPSLFRLRTIGYSHCTNPLAQVVHIGLSPEHLIFRARQALQATVARLILVCSCPPDGFLCDVGSPISADGDLSSGESRWSCADMYVLVNCWISVSNAQWWTKSSNVYHPERPPDHH